MDPTLDLAGPLSDGSLGWDSFNFTDTSIAPNVDSFTLDSSVIDGASIPGSGPLDALNVTDATAWNGGVSLPLNNPVSDTVRGFSLSTSGPALSSEEATGSANSWISQTGDMIQSVGSAAGGLAKLWGSFQSKPSPNQSASGGAQFAHTSPNPTLVGGHSSGYTSASPMTARGGGLFEALFGGLRSAGGPPQQASQGQVSRAQAGIGAGPSPFPANDKVGGQSQIGLAVLGALVAVVVAKAMG